MPAFRVVADFEPAGDQRQAIDKLAAGVSNRNRYQTLKGVTGSATLNVDEVASRVETIRNLAQLPIGVGFGIKDAESAQAVSRVADGVVVGSALVNQVAENPDNPAAINKAIAGILSDMRNAMDHK